MNHRRKQILFTTLFFLIVMNSFAQMKSEQFCVYVIKNRYALSTQKYLDSNYNYREIKILREKQIDPLDTGINYNLLKMNLNSIFPKIEDEGVLCVDIENSKFKNLMNFAVNAPEFFEAVKYFTDLILEIKKNRPFIKLGIYGLPFRTYFQNQFQRNMDGKLNSVLKHCDYIFPSLYILYPQKQNGQEANMVYLSRNLNEALTYGVNLKKAVLPFVWYMVVPSNKKFGGMIISEEEMKKYLRLIKNFDLNGTKVGGIVWWEPSDKGFEKNINKHNQVVVSRDEILKTYTNEIIKSN